MTSLFQDCISLLPTPLFRLLHCKMHVLLFEKACYNFWSEFLSLGMFWSDHADYSRSTVISDITPGEALTSGWHHTVAHLQCSDPPDECPGVDLRPIIICTDRFSGALIRKDEQGIKVQYDHLILVIWA